MTNTDNIENATLQQHQSAMLELIAEFDRVCKKLDIKYYAFAGTLLGGVRHNGFIPWDDDADVIMKREEYLRFLKLAPKEIDTEKFYLQGEYSEHWPMFFSKLRLNDTACIERYHPKDMQSHRGIYIDIFPLDNLSDNKIKRKLQYYASKIVIAKGLSRRGYSTDSFKKKLFMALCALVPLKPAHRFVINRKNCNTAMVHSFFGASKSYDKNVFDRKWFENTNQVIFENLSLPAPEHTHQLLTHLYGDYMTPLSPKDRACKVHAQIVDIHNSYEKYNEIHSKLEFDEYSRSIR